LALYAGEDEEEVFKDLDLIYQKYPREFEFYIPQLCTYLFHFESNEDNQEEEKKSELEIVSPEKDGQGQIIPTEEAVVENTGLKQFLLKKAKESLRFAHMMFWCILSSMDDTQSIQMSQHKKKELWDVLR
jgi:hypothetical protein